ncbi:hypothetical protein [Methylomonas methanica]|uniref:Uncharacterized protein n=1 Tax=Methylomonas methanica (strain DSM 25384 / MC09) TaxID=857087 RepID=G0A4S2_METMM|nr:hypothetical protein [Methylomonas methanica]AEG02813.1 hypothetical protein Metme_4470 [Methylomonas methanica MC09]
MRNGHSHKTFSEVYSARKLSHFSRGLSVENRQRSIGRVVLLMALGLRLGVMPLSALAEPGQTAPLRFLAENAAPRFKTTNDLVWDAQFQALLKADLTDVSGALLGKPQPLSETLLSVLGGPDDAIVRPDGWIIASACRQHSCDEKGLFAADVKSGARGYAVIGYFTHAGAYSDGRPVLTLVYPAETPTVFRQRFGVLARSWLKDKTGMAEPLETNVVEGISQRP